MTIMKWRISRQGYKHLTNFEDLYCSKLQLVLCKRSTLSAVSIFVTEGSFIYIYFPSFEEIHENRISKAGEKNFSNDFALFS